MVTSLLKHRQFTVEQYHRMGETGILHEDDRVELIEGEIVDMTPVGIRHKACVKRLNTLFNSLINTNQALIGVQDPLILDEYNEPEPDIVLFHYRQDYYENQHPSAEDALLVIEVADTSLPYDQNIKVPLYAKSHIQELWIVDLQSNSVQTYRSSNGESFQEIQTYSEQDTITPLAFPKHSISVSSIFGTQSKQNS